MRRSKSQIPLGVWALGAAAFGFLIWSVCIVLQITWNRQGLYDGNYRIGRLERAHDTSHRLLTSAEVAGDTLPNAATWASRVAEVDDVFRPTGPASQAAAAARTPGVAAAFETLRAIPEKLAAQPNASPAARKLIMLEAIDGLQSQFQIAREFNRAETFRRSKSIQVQWFSLIGLVLATALTLIFAAGRASRDALKRGKMEERLRAIDEKYAHVYTSGPIAYVLSTPSGHITDCNERAEKLFGWTCEELKGRHLIDLIPDQAKDSASQGHAELIREHIRARTIIPVTRRDGTERLCEWDCSVLHQANGEIESVISSVVDVTERVRSEAKIRESEARYRKLFESNLVGITLTSAKGAIFDANDAFLSMLGYTRGDVKSGRLNWQALTPPEFSPLDDEAVRELYDIGNCIPYEKEYIHKNGSRVPILIGATDFDPVNDRGQTHICFVLDRSHLRAAEERARAASTLIESIHRAQLGFIDNPNPDKAFESLLDAVLRLTRSEGGFISEVLYDADGSPHTEIRSRRDGFGHDNASQSACDLDAFVAQVVSTRRPVIAEPSASDSSLSTFLGLPFSRGGTLLGVIGIANRPGGYSIADVHLLEPLVTTCASLVSALRAERRRSEAEADLQATKETAVAANQAKDRFLAVLSHELRTPLTPVLAAVSLARTNPPNAVEVRALCDMITRNVELEARLIDDLLDISRINRGLLRLDLAVVDSHKLIHDVIKICHEDMLLAELTADLDLTADSHHIEVDPARFQQVLWNLIKNSVKFTPAGGRIVVRTENAETPSGTMLRISVTDTGVGLNINDHERIFREFERGEASQRTHAPGLGLGLSISRSVVETHGGTLKATSPGRDMGATFTIQIATAAPPIISPTYSPSSSGELSPLAPPRQLSILFVEDNRDTRQILTLLLQHAGHRVHSVGTVAAALSAAEGESFDLLLSDIQLPDGTGLELIRQIRSTRDEPIAAIAMSGFGSDDDVGQSLDAGFALHLTKPIDYRRLCDAIDRAMSPMTVAH